MASRLLSDLSGDVARRADAFVDECRACGIDPLIYCTLRSLSEQAQLYKVGRDLPGKIITMARPGESLHNPDADGKASAFDAVPMRNGKALWSDAEAILQMGICGESVGLVWAGRWRGAMRESVHFQGET